MRIEIGLAGSGGQGLITAGIILAEAAGLHGGKHVCQTQSYGPEARGGASRSEVVISDQPIHYPKAQQLDILLAMTQAACDRYFHDLKPDGTLIVDADLVTSLPTSTAIAVPITRLVREALDREVFANIAALGVVAATTGAVSAEALAAAVSARVPPESRKANRSALRIGLEAGRAAREARQTGEYAADA